MEVATPKQPRETFAASEKRILLDLVENLESGKLKELLIGGNGARIKEYMVWEKLAMNFSEALGRMVTKDQTRNLFNNMKSRKKKQYDNRLMDYSQNGSSPSRHGDDPTEVLLEDFMETSNATSSSHSDPLLLEVLRSKLGPNKSSNSDSYHSREPVSRKRDTAADRYFNNQDKRQEKLFQLQAKLIRARIRHYNIMSDIAVGKVKKEAGGSNCEVVMAMGAEGDSDEGGRDDDEEDEEGEGDEDENDEDESAVNADTADADANHVYRKLESNM